MRLTVDGVVTEQPVTIKLDPRSIISESDLQLQTDNSMTCYTSYQKLQAIREAIDKKLSDTKAKWAKGIKEQVLTFRGQGAPDNPDVMYGSISETTLEKETIVGLQDKFLHLMAVFQGADVRPTTQASQAVEKLTLRRQELVERWKVLSK